MLTPGRGYPGAGGTLPIVTDREEVIRRAYEAWGRGDLDGMLATLDPEIDYWTSGIYPGLRNYYHGHEGMRRFWSDFHDMWEQIEIHPARFEEHEDLVVALWDFRGRGRGGIAVERPGAHLVRFAGDRVVWMKSFGEWEDAFSALRYELARG